MPASSQADFSAAQPAAWSGSVPASSREATSLGSSSRNASTWLL